MPTPERRRSPWRWVGRGVLAAVVVALVVGGWTAYRAAQRALFSPTCRATASGTSFTFTPEQSANAALISAVAVRRGLPPRAATIALATALQESKLRNLTYGDRDSLGLFQQRPSQGWGTAEQILDPVHATNAFYDALVKVPGWSTGDVTKVAQAVQRSGYPEAYADHEGQGRVLASTLTGQSPAGFGCRLADVARSGDLGAVTAGLDAQFGSGVGAGAQRSGSTLTLTAGDGARAWAMAQWAVANADGYGLTAVEVAGQRWARGTGDDALAWSAGGAAGATTVVLRTT
ncbi:hypothetical protein [Lapillicoccus jejuensis]|uniref:Uncharacterized protein n=1 Tax=Lapillicoccus jejuensis TaxID=402171 RepID=A0A542DWD9_9MICO|nr:hypothetical protein [Lapillicoccus jejuensis]TQJ07376.1 hypothetical protein FB458_0437 [Lapillicoccus jejuensis]